MTSKHKMAKNPRAQGGYRLAQDKVMTANSLGRLQASTRRSLGGVPLIVLQPWGVGGLQEWDEISQRVVGAIFRVFSNLVHTQS